MWTGDLKEMIWVTLVTVRTLWCLVITSMIQTCYLLVAVVTFSQTLNHPLASSFLAANPPCVQTLHANIVNRVMSHDNDYDIPIHSQLSFRSCLWPTVLTLPDWNCGVFSNRGGSFLEIWHNQPGLNDSAPRTSSWSAAAKRCATSQRTPLATLQTLLPLQPGQEICTKAVYKNLASAAFKACGGATEPVIGICRIDLSWMGTFWFCKSRMYEVFSQTISRAHNLESFKVPSLRWNRHGSLHQHWSMVASSMAPWPQQP